MLSIDISAIVIFLLIWVLVFILTKLFFNPLRKVVDERKTRLRNNQEASSKAIAEYEEIVKEIEENIKSARSAANTIREEFEQRALREKEKILDNVSKECRAQVSEAKAEIDKQMQTLKKELKKESENLAEKIEKKLLDS
jgi:F-type H+-transporting ATPase subunit b